MAYNSDGYIMIDFTEVDFRRTNQTIEGLYKRCVDVIGTNKFILVINANGRTPLPATCSFTNNQYVIDTCIYMFAISSNDNLFIRRNDVPASDIIDDSSVSVDKTWSSNKIDTELDGKQDTLTPVSPVSINGNNEISVDLSGKQDVLTPVSPISINADNEISVDLSGKQDVLTPVNPISINADNEISVDLSGKQDILTAGNNISITDNIISADIDFKTFDYTGTGTTTKTITFPITPKYVFISKKNNSNTFTNLIIYNNSTAVGVMVMTGTAGAGVNYRYATISYNDNEMTLNGGSYSLVAMNDTNVVYTVYYI